MPIHLFEIDHDWMSLLYRTIESGLLSIYLYFKLCKCISLSKNELYFQKLKLIVFDQFYFLLLHFTEIIIAFWYI